VKKASKVVVWMVILAVVGIGIGAWVHAKGGKKTPTVTTGEGERRMPVVSEAVREMVFEERVVLSGDVEAKNTALVSARIPGIVDEIFVDEGDTVEAGQKLFQTEKVKLSRAVEASQQQVGVAEATVRAREATVVRIEADLVKVQLDYDRYKRLYEDDHAITQSALEGQESHLKQVQAGLVEAKAGLELSKAQVEQAKSSLAIAEKDLEDSLVMAPIGGKVSVRFLEPGENAKAGTPVVRVDDLGVVELAAYLPEAYYIRVVEGTTKVSATVQGIALGEVVVTTKSPTVQPQLRTFEIKALVKNPPAGVVPGARAELEVILEKHTGLGVPRSSVIRRGQGWVVFTVREGAARMVAVTTGLESSGWLEVRGEGLAKEMPVVRMGQDRLNEGTSIVEVKEGAQ